MNLIMDEDKFVITDSEGIPEGIKDPLDMIIDPSPVIPNPRSRGKRPPMPKISAPKEPKQDPAPRRPGRPSKSDLQKEVENEIEAMLMLGSGLWSTRDEECAGVLNKQSKQIAESLAAILAKNPKLLERMRDMTGLGDYMKLAMAILPVAQAINKHHVAPQVQKRSDNNG